GGGRGGRWRPPVWLARDDGRPSPAPHPPQPPFDWRTVWADSIDSSRPLFLAVETSALEEATSAAPSEPSVLLVPEPEAPQRAQLWKTLLPPGEVLRDSDLADLAGRFRFNPRRAARAVRR